MTTDGGYMSTGCARQGESKAKFHYDYWAKDIAPSADFANGFMLTHRTDGRILAREIYV